MNPDQRLRKRVEGWSHEPVIRAERSSTAPRDGDYIGRAEIGPIRPVGVQGTEIARLKAENAALRKEVERLRAQHAP